MLAARGRKAWNVALSLSRIHGSAAAAIAADLTAADISAAASLIDQSPLSTETVKLVRGSLRRLADGEAAAAAMSDDELFDSVQ